MQAQRPTHCEIQQYQFHSFCYLIMWEKQNASNSVVSMVLRFAFIVYNWPHVTQLTALTRYHTVFHYNKANNIREYCIVLLHQLSGEKGSQPLAHIVFKKWLNNYNKWNWDVSWSSLFNISCNQRFCIVA